jgi:alkaline phosphatase D
LLGGDQERWLGRGLAASSARWDVLVQQVFFARADIGSGKTTRVNIGRLGWLRGHAHADLRRDRGGQRPQRGGAHRRRPRQLGQRGAARRADDPGSKRVATEFVGTSISTGGDGADQRTDTARIRSRNPHIKFFNAPRGYLRCRVTASRWRTDYRVLDRVSRYGSGVSTRASFVVEDGRAALERLDTGRPSARTAVSSETETDRIRAEREAER